MLITVKSIKKFEGKSGFKGYAAVELTDEQTGQKMTINGFTIKTTQKGALIATPPQQKAKDEKYYDVVTLHDKLLWDVSNVIVAAYKGENVDQSSGGGSKTKADAMSQAPTHNPYDENDIPW